MDPRRPKVAILGTRFPNFDIERDVLGEVDIVSGPGTSRQDVLEVGTGADVVLLGAAPVFDATVLEALGCPAIVRLGVGVDNVDIEAAGRIGITVSYVPDYGTEAVAFHTVALILAALRRIPMADRYLRAGSWGVSELRPLHLPAHRAVGIVGYGRIGRRVASMLAGVGFERFLITDPWVDHDDIERGELRSLEDLLSEADIVTLHAPPPGDSPLLDAAQLALMREGSILVNTARGSLVDTTALVEALRGGRPALAALDVFDPEPPEIGLFAGVGDRVILTPHMSWYTEESERELRRLGAEEARRLIDGRSPLHPVVAPMAAET